MCRPDRLMHHNKPQFGLRIRNSIEIIAGSPTSSFTKTILTKRRLYLCGRTILTKRFIIAIINNEQLKNIDVEQEGEYDYYTAGSTLHQGFEYELSFYLSSNLQYQMNGMFNDHHFSGGINKGKKLTNIPVVLVNVGLNWQVYQDANVSANWKYVGTRYIDKENYGTIDPYSVFDVYFSYRWQNLRATLKVNNIFDALYSTHGYGYEGNGYQAYYWPGATRNIFLTISYHM